MDRLSSIGRFDLQHAAEARRDRWLIPLLVVLGMLAGAACSLPAWPRLHDAAAMPGVGLRTDTLTRASPIRRAPRCARDHADWASGQAGTEHR